MTTATKTQPQTRSVCILTGADHESAQDCSTHRHRIESVPATTETPTITLSNFRVTYRAPRYEDGKVLYDGYCAILANSAEYDGAEVRVFDVPDVDEGQLATALFACDAMNQHERYVKLLEAAKLLIAMNNCNYDRDQMRRSGGFDAVAEAVEAIQPNWTKSTKEQTNGTR